MQEDYWDEKTVFTNHVLILKRRRWLVGQDLPVPAIEPECR